VQGDAAFGEQVIHENALEFADNGEATHPWTRECDEGELVINLTQANQPITRWSIPGEDHTMDLTMRL
jgi:hypothetical protein